MVEEYQIYRVMPWFKKREFLSKAEVIITLGDNDESCGDNALYKAIGENIVEIRDYIEKHGGFKLYEEDIEE